MANSIRDETLLGDPEFANLIDELTERLQAHRDVDLDDYLKRYPQYAEQLEQLFPSMQTLIGLGHGPDASNADEPEPPSSTPLGTTGGKLGDFRIIREIGRGGMGVVYEVEQISLRRRMALKVLPFAGILDEQALKRFKNEALAAATLNHPNIVQVHSVGSDRGVHYYAMQLIEGQTLADTIRELRRTRKHRSDGRADEISDVGSLSAAIAAGSFQPQANDGEVPVTEPSKPAPATSPTADTQPELKAAASTVPSLESRAYFRTVAGLGIQAAEALEHAHVNGISHRDIKPGNLMIDGTGKLWVTDFGLARIEACAPMTMTGDMLGTLRYMCPEMAAGGRERLVVDQRTDIYSLGVTLYELLTLEPAFDGKDRKELFQKIIFAEPRAPRRISKSIPANLETVVLKAMRKDPVDRYATASELAKDLRRFLDDEPIRAKPPTLLERTRMWSRRNRTIVAAAAILLMVVTIGSLLSAGLVWQEQKQTAKALEESRQNEQMAELKATESKAVVDFLINKLLGSAAPNRSKDDPVTVNEVLINAEANIETAFVDQPLVEAAVRHAMGVAYRALGRLDASQRHLDAARQIRTELLGAIDADTLETTLQFASLRLAQGHNEEARVLQKQVLEIRRRTLGTEHIDTVDSMNRLAISLMSLGKHMEAEELFKEVVQTLRRSGVRQHDAKALNPLHNLAHVLYSQGKYQDARQLYEELVELKKDLFGPTDPDTLATMNNLAATLGGLGDNEEALKIAQKVLEVRQDTLGDHAETFRSMYNVAARLVKLQRHEEAYKLRKECVDGLGSELPTNHPDIFRAKMGLAGDLKRAQKPDEALALYKEVLEGQRRALPSDHPNTLHTMNSLGILFTNEHQLDEARDILERALELRLGSSHSGPEHPKTLNVMHNLATTLYDLGDVDRARGLREKVLEIRRRKQGDEHPDTIKAMRKLAEILTDQGEFARAGELRQKVLALYRIKPGPSHADTLESMVKLAYTLMMQGELVAAQDLYQQVLEIRQDKLGSNNSATVESLICVAYVLLRQEEFDQAREYYEQVRDLGSNNLGADNPDMLDSMSWLAMLYNEQGAFDEARPLAADTLERLERVKGEEHESTLRTKTFLAESLEGLGQQLEAHQLWEELLKLIERNPSLPAWQKASFMCGMALNIASTRDSRPDELERASELTKAAVELDTDDGESWQALGVVLSVSGHWKKSLEAFNKAIELGYEGKLITPAILEQIEEPENQSDEDFQQLMEFVRKK